MEVFVFEPVFLTPGPGEMHEGADVSIGYSATWSSTDTAFPLYNILKNTVACSWQ
uniref:Uncharacterized protein n=1 Tax=Anguilla anguilla TaxID=7936 RepID=A0A0E9TFX1_ANGAN